MTIMVITNHNDDNDDDDLCVDVRERTEVFSQSEFRDINKIKKKLLALLRIYC